MIVAIIGIALAVVGFAAGWAIAGLRCLAEGLPVRPQRQPRRTLVLGAVSPARPLSALPEPLARRVLAGELRRLGVATVIPVGPVPTWSPSPLDRPRYGATWGAA